MFIFGPDPEWRWTCDLKAEDEHCVPVGTGIAI